MIELAVIALPLLRPLRLLPLVAVLAVLNRGVSASLRGRVAVYAVWASLTTVIVGGLAMLNVERGTSEGNIQTAGEAW